ncbi:hypothetical protein GCM10010206_35090 [Streptomyces cinerochromogenes]|nr:hypothetical protein GCM10010206_35090 [Streptomyces cinerochromogenes]
MPGEGAQQLGQLGSDVARPRPPRTIQHTFPRLRRLQPEERAPRTHSLMNAARQMQGIKG